jgi:hypothetical protein
VKARAVALVDASSWLEAYVVDELVAVEFHRPRREASVGYVDHHTDAAGKLERLRSVVARALADHPRGDLAELVASLERQIREQASSVNRAESP